MLLNPAIASVALLAASVVAHPSAKAQAADAPINPSLQISNLLVNYTLMGNTTLSFEVMNPEPKAAQGKAQCRAEWSNVAHDWPVREHAMKCVNSTSITWYIAQWTSAMNFGIALQDKYSDPSLGKPPYDQAAIFSKAIVNATFVEYDSTDEKATSISGWQKPGLILSAIVYAVSAK